MVLKIFSLVRIISALTSTAFPASKRVKEKLREDLPSNRIVYGI